MTRIFVMLCAASILGCVVAANPGDSATIISTGASPASDGASETSAGEATQSPTTTSETSGVSSTSTGSGTVTGGILVMPDIGDGNPIECDFFAQDCEDGMKCVPYVTDDGNIWNAIKCVPVTGDQQVEEPCASEGGGTGIDDCAKGVICWDVDLENHGTCHALCTGPRDGHPCNDPGSVCGVVSDTYFNVCYPNCEPLLQDCPGAQLCLPVYESYICVLDASGAETGAAFDSCEYANACDPGLICLPPTSAAECDQGATGCCSPMCSLADDGATCPDAGQQCFPMYEPQPPGYEEVGYCSLMP